jgi:hypothetical protein
MKGIMKRTITNDQGIELTIIQYQDKHGRTVNLGYRCLTKDRQNNGNYVDRGKLIISVNKRETYRVPYHGTFTNERSSILTTYLSDIVNRREPGEVLWGQIENKIIFCCGSCYIK